MSQFAIVGLTMRGQIISRRACLAATVTGALLFASSYSVPARGDDDPWPEIHKSVFSSRPIEEPASGLQIFAPNQAEDAAVVPVSITIAPKLVTEIRSLTLLIDRNPVPVAATFAFADAFRAAPDSAERSITTRIRVDAFSRVRAVAETMDGRLLMASKFVIGAGGCSAPAQKDAEKALSELGKTQVKLSSDPARSSTWREAQIMIKHPNFTGMQMNKATGDYTPARFVEAIDVRSGGELLFKMTAGISISENPNIRFTFGTSTPADLEFTAKDTDGAAFHGSSRPDPS